MLLQEVLIQGQLVVRVALLRVALLLLKEKHV